MPRPTGYISLSRTHSHIINAVPLVHNWDRLSRPQSYPPFGVVKLLKSFLQGAMNEDRISQLPDPLIGEILNRLPTKDSVKTSVLSTRWRNLWLCVPSLALDSRKFPDFDAFWGFGDRFFDSNSLACLQKLRLTIFDYFNIVDVSRLTAWMDAAAKRKIQDLYFRWEGELPIHTKQLRLYKCETLISLKLAGVTFDDAEFVSFPCLKTMILFNVSYPNITAFEKLMSRCPVLEELDIYFDDDDDDDDKKGFKVHSQSLKRFTLIRESAYLDAVPGVIIDAPLLCSLIILDPRTESVTVNNLDPNAMLEISLYFGLGDFDESKRNELCNLLSGISSVRDITIYEKTFERIMDFLKVESLSPFEFGFLSRLDAILYPSDLKYFPTFLESCPNLKSLELRWIYDIDEFGEMSFSSVPKCLQSSLEFINITVPSKYWGEDIKIVRYFLENSAIVKKFTLCFEDRTLWTEKYIRECLHKIPRGSSKCEVHVTFD